MSRPIEPTEAPILDGSSRSLELYCSSLGLVTFDDGATKPSEGYPLLSSQALSASSRSGLVAFFDQRGVYLGTVDL